ncbi:hypothetical protein [Pseudarthrobacter sp. efr-133-R2A-89]|uniref:hypothetical protein n=1 Tax=Pseudarthrobacter sp. efr-133-R2A-89 TaxID=3040302 RepID=UPI0025569D7C|nr:hypothetical protein [Pseudarthrobacter sp. efr-133-R2A-89]
MSVDSNLPAAIRAASSLASGLVNPSLLVTLHRDIEKLEGKDGKPLGRSSKQYALRWGIFTTTYAAVEGFFNEALSLGSDRTRHLPLNPDKLRQAGQRAGVQLFTNEWGIRTRTPGRTGSSRSRWRVYSGTQELQAYLADMKNLRNILSHGGDPQLTSNASGALWPLAGGKYSMRLMGAEGFIQASCDLAAQTVLAFGGRASDFPHWPEPERSGLSAERRPSLKLLP